MKEEKENESTMSVCRKGTLPWKWIHRKLSLRCAQCPHCYIENNGKVECDIFLSNEPCPVEENKDEK